MAALPLPFLNSFYQILRYIIIIRRKRTQSKLLAKQKCNTAGFLLRACLHGGGGPQVGKVTRLGGVTRLSM